MRTILRHSPFALRFWASVDKRTPDECWVFVGSTDREGYGRIFENRGRTRLAHHYSWEVENGRPWPRGMVALHACDNPPCVNPAHIRPGTIQDNNADKMAKRRQPCGENAANTKLTERAAFEILMRRRRGERARALAREFGISDSLVCAIANGRKWTHLAPAVAALNALVLP